MTRRPSSETAKNAAELLRVLLDALPETKTRDDRAMRLLVHGAAIGLDASAGAQRPS